jgi:diguanylate cyclase (GGDEF)-like protein
VLVFPKPGTQFETILQEHPTISAEILHKILVDIAVRIRKANALVKENSPLVQELRKQVYRDKLTGLFNQTYLEEKTGELIHRKGNPFSLLIIKPDNFKALNDQYGHEAGDIAIRVIGRALRKHVGDDEKVVRYKGNAMAVIMPECGKKEAFKKAEGIRDFMKSLDLTEATGGPGFNITSSIGITLFPEHGKDPEELIQKSHELPLVGRARGGDQVLFPEDA